MYYFYLLLQDEVMKRIQVNYIALRIHKSQTYNNRYETLSKNYRKVIYKNQMRKICETTTWLLPCTKVFTKVSAMRSSLNK